MSNTASSERSIETVGQGTFVPGKKGNKKAGYFRGDELKNDVFYVVGCILGQKPNGNGLRPLEKRNLFGHAS